MNPGLRPTPPSPDETITEARPRRRDPRVTELSRRAHAMIDNPPVDRFAAAIISALALRILQILWLHTDPKTALRYLGDSG